MPPIRDAGKLLGLLRIVHQHIRERVLAAVDATDLESLAAVDRHQAGDTVYAVDRVSEAVLIAELEAVAREWPCLVVAEGLGQDGRRVLPAGTPEERIEIVVVVDPIDGTRGFMYQKRPAWILTGVAPFTRDRPATLADIALALQTELPLQKQHLADAAWAIAGQGAQAERWNRVTGERTPLALTPSRATTIAHGFGGLAKFFPGLRAELAAIDDSVVQRLLGRPPEGVALAFEDQYLSSGGQLYELMSGHDRWIADLRPLFDPVLRARGDVPGLYGHPYDLCTELIAREAGVIVTDAFGDLLAAPLDVESPVAWIGYANRVLADSIAPALRAELIARGLIPPKAGVRATEPRGPAPSARPAPPQP